MPSPDNDKKQNALAREWAAARIVVIGGFIIAIATAGYFWYRDRQETLAEQQPAAVATVAVPHKLDPKKLAIAELLVCRAELQRAQAIRIVPQYATLATARLFRGNAARRFICVASTPLTKYFISADLLCGKLTDPRCVSIFRIATASGMLVYSRRK